MKFGFIDLLWSIIYLTGKIGSIDRLSKYQIQIQLEYYVEDKKKTCQCSCCIIYLIQIASGPILPAVFEKQSPHARHDP